MAYIFFRWINIKLHTRFPTKVVILGAYLVLSPNRLTYHLTLIDTWTSVQRNAKQFYRRNRFTFVCVLCWYIEYHECLCCTPLKEDTPLRSPAFFIKEKSELRWFVLDYRMLKTFPIIVLFTTIMEQIG